MTIHFVNVEMAVLGIYNKKYPIIGWSRTKKKKTGRLMTRVFDKEDCGWTPGRGT